MISLFSSKKNRRKSIWILLLIILVFTLLTYLISTYFQLFSNPSYLRSEILRFGSFGPVVLIIAQILQVLIAPLPGQLFGLASGYIYGTFLGTLYTMIGTTLGTYIAILLARKFGRPFVEKVIDKKTLKKFDNACNDRALTTLFFIWLLPALPDDAIAFMAGLTKIEIKFLVFASFVGRLPGFFVLNVVGDGLATLDPAFALILFLVMMAVSILIYWKREHLEHLMTKSAHVLRAVFK